MLASLRMYDLPEVRSATDAWWRGVAAALERAGLESVPASLNWDANIDVLRSPELLLGQTCGYPLTHALADVVELVATPAYSADGCSGADYCSLIVVSEDNPAAALAALRGAVCAYSRRDSHSGYNALRAAIAPLADGSAFFSQVVESGRHAMSIGMVARGEADICAVDCVTHALLARYRPDTLSGTRVLARTESAPGLPYVTHAGAPSETVRRLRDGLRTAASDPGLMDVRESLFLSDIYVLGDDAYRRIEDMEDSARAAGYAEIH